MAREDRFTTTPEDAAAFERDHADTSWYDDGRPSASDLADFGIGGERVSIADDESWAKAARDLWGAIPPQDEPPF